MNKIVCWAMEAASTKFGEDRTRDTRGDIGPKGLLARTVP